MKNWKEDLKNSEDNFDWISSVDIYKSVISSNLSVKEILELNVRLMFVITYCILECNCSNDDYIYGKNVVHLIYKESYEKFKNNSDYLFCLSVITRLNEDMFEMDLEQPDVFFKKAIELEPNIDLYLYWSVRFGEKITFDKKYLYSEFIKDWKKQKGLLGKYVVDYLRDKY